MYNSYIIMLDAKNIRAINSKCVSYDLNIQVDTKRGDNV